MNTDQTLRTLTHPGFAWDPHLELDDPVPVLRAPQAQGDIYILPDGCNRGVKAMSGEGEPLPPLGYEVIIGQGIRNSHTLVDLTGNCRIIVGTTGYEFDVCTLVVPTDEDAAYQLHREHGANGIGAGRYVIRRQRQQSDIQRAVED